jgi:hypothetical protein
MLPNLLLLSRLPLQLLQSLLLPQLLRLTLLLLPLNLVVIGVLATPLPLPTHGELVVLFPLVGKLLCSSHSFFMTTNLGGLLLVSLVI